MAVKLSEQRSFASLLTFLFSIHVLSTSQLRQHRSRLASAAAPTDTPAGFGFIAVSFLCQFIQSHFECRYQARALCSVSKESKLLLR
jgi:hypothetical protein